MPKSTKPPSPLANAAHCLRGFGPLAGRSFELRPLRLALGHDRLEFLEVHSKTLRTTNLPLGHAFFPGMVVRFLTTNERVYPIGRIRCAYTKAGPARSSANHEVATDQQR